ncbi:hypothetical protein PABY_23130 [Pyrodictium abyssi]|uniref:Uncharacterized protein n=1 Tax=Pyrodictium abyssi TaxID=54256 RepID=A0ABM8IYX0_9CREN|nr:hypothetical protein PABY_23130 [Pyrodictium abyssi]
MRRAVFLYLGAWCGLAGRAGFFAEPGAGGWTFGGELGAFCWPLWLVFFVYGAMGGRG